MSYEQINESAYLDDPEKWEKLAEEYRSLGGIGICDDRTGKELYTI